MRQTESDVSLPAPIDRERSRKILTISATLEDHESLRRILQEPDWSITRAFSCQQAIACLCRDRIGVILCDSQLPDGTWRDILSHIAEMTEPPSVIVTSARADANLRAEVRTLGGYQLLSQPFFPEEVGRVVSAAWRERVQTGALIPA
jgi:DNA-binding response OmpR family regulator